MPGWLAVKLAADRIDLAHVDRTGARPRVLLCDSYRREGDVVASLVRLRKELQLDRYRCTTLLESNEYQLNQIEAPSVPPAELREAVKWRVKDIVDYPVESVAIDVLDIPVDAGARSHSVYAVSARGDTVMRHAQPFQDSDVPLDVIDIPELAQRNIAALAEDENRGLALLVFDDDGGMLTLTFRGELYSSRRIETSVHKLVEAQGDARAQLHDRIALELQRTLDHFDRQYSFITLSKLLLGPLPGDTGLAEYLATNLYVPVESLDLAALIDFGAVPELAAAGRQTQCMQLIGAALRDEGSAP